VHTHSESNLPILALLASLWYLWSAHHGDPAGRAFLLWITSGVDQSLRRTECFKLMNAMADTEEALVEIFIGPIERASVIRALLAAYGLQVFLRDSAFGIESPSYYEPIGGSRTFKVLVRQSDFHTAQAIIEAPPEHDPGAKG